MIRVDCKEIRQLLPSYLEDDLKPGQKKLVKEHLSRCPDCTKIFNSLKETVSSLRSLEKVKAPTDFLEGIHEKIEAYERGGSAMKTNILYQEDNLRLMRGLPSGEIDLIYSDPAPFSPVPIPPPGLQRLLKDMEERLKEMHRLLKSNGSIYVHLCSTIAHYIKVDMDRIFGYNHFRDEIIWPHKRGIDTILFYTKSGRYTFHEPKRASRMGDIWPDIPEVEHPKIRDQKPVALLEHIIKTSSNKGDLVADFYCGSGTTLVAAHKLSRQWIGCDNSRAAIKIAQFALEDAGVKDIPIQKG